MPFLSNLSSSLNSFTVLSLLVDCLTLIQSLQYPSSRLLDVTYYPSSTYGVMAIILTESAEDGRLS